MSTTTAMVVVWIMALLGITFQILYHERYKLLETCCYIIVGLLPAIVIIDMVRLYKTRRKERITILFIFFLG